MGFKIGNLFKRKSPSIKPVSSNTAKVAGGGATATILAIALLINPWEGNELKPYLDVGGIPTACGGIIGPEITKAYNEGRVFTEAECEVRNIAAVEKHEKALRKSINDDVEARIPALTMAAFISWAYNVGNGAADKSTLIRLVNQGRFKDACEQLSRWTMVKGVVIRGLQNRRVIGDANRLSERTVCLIGIDPSYKTPLFDRLMAKVKK